MSSCPVPHLREFGDDLVVVRRSEGGVMIRQMGTDFGSSEATLHVCLGKRVRLRRALTLPVFRCALPLREWLLFA